MILKNDEEKRSTLWRTVLTVSTILIIIVAVFFIVRLFVGNPLKGTWVSEDSGAVLEILDDGELKMSGAGDGSGKEEISATCVVDTKEKILTVHTDFGTAEGVLSGSYDYNLEQDILTLTEREYGDQLVFIRK